MTWTCVHNGWVTHKDVPFMLNLEVKYWWIYAGLYVDVNNAVAGLHAYTVHTHFLQYIVCIWFVSSIMSVYVHSIDLLN